MMLMMGLVLVLDDGENAKRKPLHGNDMRNYMKMNGNRNEQTNKRIKRKKYIKDRKVEEVHRVKERNEFGQR